MTSGAKSAGRFGKQDFLYLPEEDVYRCPAGEHLQYYYTNVENGLKLHRYWTNAYRTCALKGRCTTAVQCRITWWEHEHVLEAVQRRLDEDPQAMRRRRETVEHPFGTIKARMGATYFLMTNGPCTAPLYDSGSARTIPLLHHARGHDRSRSGRSTWSSIRRPMGPDGIPPVYLSGALLPDPS
jgi:Transposase DDE domain